MVGSHVQSSWLISTRDMLCAHSKEHERARPQAGHEGTVNKMVLIEAADDACSQLGLREHLKCLGIGTFYFLHEYTFCDLINTLKSQFCAPYSVTVFHLTYLDARNVSSCGYQ